MQLRLGSPLEADAGISVIQLVENLAQPRVKFCQLCLYGDLACLKITDISQPGGYFAVLRLRYLHTLIKHLAASNSNTATGAAGSSRCRYLPNQSSSRSGRSGGSRSWGRL